MDDESNARGRSLRAMGGNVTGVTTTRQREGRTAGLLSLPEGPRHWDHERVRHPTLGGVVPQRLTTDISLPGHAWRVHRLGQGITTRGFRHPAAPRCVAIVADWLGGPGGRRRGFPSPACGTCGHVRGARLSRRREVGPPNRECREPTAPARRASKPIRPGASTWLLSAGCCSRASNTFRRACDTQAAKRIRPRVTFSMLT